MANELKIFNSDIIPVYDTDTGEKVVLGRELHERLKIKTAYKDWFPRMCEYGFVNGKDYGSFLSNRSDGLAGKPRTNHIITLDMAKHIAMIQRTPEGMEIRQKLIDLEKKANSGLMIEALCNPDSVIQLLTAYSAEQKKAAELAAKNAELTPKAEFADAITASKATILIGNLATVLKQNGCDIGQNRLFRYLRENGYLIAQKGDRYNTPTQRAMDIGLFEVDTSLFTTAYGNAKISYTTRVTPKGQQYFIDKFVKERGANLMIPEAV